MQSGLPALTLLVSATSLGTSSCSVCRSGRRTPLPSRAYSRSNPIATKALRQHFSPNESHDTRYDSQRHHTIWRPDSVPEPAGGSIPPRGREHRSSAESQPGEISRLTISSRSVNAFQYSSRLLLTAYCLLLAVRCLLLASGFSLFSFRFSL